jgi:hypothetical protein
LILTRNDQLPTPLLVLFSAIRLISTFGGPECRLGLAGELGNESRFFAGPKDPFSGVPKDPFSGIPKDPFSGVPFFSDPNGLCNLVLALADLVGTI